MKIVDKKLRGGRLYLKKGTVVDVKTPTLCDVFMDGLNESVLVGGPGAGGVGGGGGGVGGGVCVEGVWVGRTGCVEGVWVGERVGAGGRGGRGPL